MTYQVKLLDKTSKSEVSQCLDLLQNSFKGSLEYFKWKHNFNETQEIEEYTFCIFKDNLCIATTQAIINVIIINGEKYRFGILCDGATHKDYRRLGLFEDLLSHINEFGEKNDVAFVYSTGNEKSRKALLKLGFEDFFTTLKATKRVRYNHPLMMGYNLFLNNFGKFTFKKTDNIKEISIKDYVVFSAQQKSQHTISYEKTEGYLKWRLADPTGNYKIYGSLNDNQILEAVLVVKASKNLLYIVDAIYNNETSYLTQLVKYVYKLAILDKNVLKINSVHNNFKNIKEVFEANKFNIATEGSSALLFALKPGFKISQSELEMMHYMRIDKNE
ncbi:GNAT family N-acetyltransferase [Bizionia arctica]|uniref:Uncharacterized protein n=1 Tax=Bizionia arctica TaxID=1495645 RepID=A0A917GX73_9FLAO|nr:GNAT family N-acetyltransferase [Bizionia arctica]GGG60091.1 hypothetical protein GCM10010976_33550 [Bizionia arctica]